ncbi:MULTISPECIES: hypothetical protein [unclassified Rothia (in: high G+C Gram-positive bacteria)]|uniref:hypothetical protein n=1 Tax=unclassified Rothia (in: high G+C Gram-positive bacteria) TaxID=2689056 RepID=UPI00195DDE42|nr:MULTISPECIES: hypothetical protein [unclassified Rothia (in: high G+C Gram-positive bacteria)]MBM7051307.1 hypothetical protein [Rothia sp. ZJ1223]QRZ61099.1 hypothetical protein JR346_07520 [Rothia sp. ZJ932]
MVQQAKNSGFGRLLVVIYAVFSLSATARALYQVIRKFDEAPLSISLSALSALIYIVATVALAKKGSSAWKLSLAAVSAEMVGVLLIGVFSYIRPDLFELPSVWSHFGSGYGYIPLLLPMVGLWWLNRTRSHSGSRVTAEH